MGRDQNSNRVAAAAMAASAVAVFQKNFLKKFFPEKKIP